MKIYTGQDKTDTPASTKIVMDLDADLLGKGYTIFLDNWFSSPFLFQELHSKRTNIVGTVRKNRKNMPMNLRNLKLKKGEVDFRSSENGLLALVWKDKKDIRMLHVSIMHTASMEDTGKHDRKGNPIRKPMCVIEYNEGMKGVDLADQLHASSHIHVASSHRSVRKSIKLYKKLFFYLLDVCLVNSYLVHKELGGTEQFLNFRLALVKEIFESQFPSLPTYRTRGRPYRLPGQNRLFGRHSTVELPPTEKRAKTYKLGLYVKFVKFPSVLLLASKYIIHKLVK